jgi:hypothetical protein
MIVWVAIIPDNELLGVFSTEEKCRQAIESNSRAQDWGCEPECAVVDEVEDL